jgi:hypothetical protein
MEGSAILQNLSEEIRECFRRAEECKRLSKTALTALAIKDYRHGAAMADSRSQL